MEIHELKIFPQYFNEVLSGNKKFELRKDDRGFEVGDILILKEYRQGEADATGPELVVVEESGYTGREVKKEVSYIYKGCSNGLGLRTGFSILSLRDYIEYGSIEDNELDEWNFTDNQKEIIKKAYREHKKGFFPNPMYALY